MKETIDKVIEMNDKAKKIIEDAQNKAVDIVSEAQQKADAMMLEAKSEADDKLKNLESDSKKSVETEINRINEQRLVSEKALKDKFAENEEKWIDEIVVRITGGNDDA